MNVSDKGRFGIWKGVTLKCNYQVFDLKSSFSEDFSRSLENNFLVENNFVLTKCETLSMHQALLVYKF